MDLYFFFFSNTFVSSDVRRSFLVFGFEGNKNSIRSIHDDENSFLIKGVFDVVALERLSDVRNFLVIPRFIRCNLTKILLVISNENKEYKHFLSRRSKK